MHHRSPKGDPIKSVRSQRSSSAACWIDCAEKFEAGRAVVFIGRYMDIEILMTGT